MRTENISCMGGTANTSFQEVCNYLKFPGNLLFGLIKAVVKTSNIPSLVSCVCDAVFLSCVQGFMPFTVMPFVLESSLNNSPIIILFAFPFELWNTIKYFHIILPNKGLTNSITGSARSSFVQSACSIHLLLHFWAWKFYWFRRCSLFPELKMTRTCSTL